MESPPQQVQKILDQMYSRIPKALGIAVRIHFGTLPPSAAGNREDVARYAAYVARRLQPRARPNPPTAPRAPLRLDSDVCYVRHHDEDCHFFHPVAGVIGVADGEGCRVGGVDAAGFSRVLMQNAFSEVSASDLGKHVRPYTILDRAYERTAASGTPGASTAVVVSLAGRALKWAYVGDSGFALFRDGKLLHRFEPQNVHFNCPVQLRAAANSINKVSDAAVGEIDVEEGDILVVASDGLFDNVFDSTLEGIVQSGTVLGCTPEEMAGAMVLQAYNMSLNTTNDSPFSVASRKCGRARTGGKPDDITVVVAFIESQDSGFFGY